MHENELKKEHVIADVVSSLCAPESYRDIIRRGHQDEPMPSVEILSQIVEELRAILFPGFYGPSDLSPETMHYYIGASIDRVHRMFAEQMRRGFCFTCENGSGSACASCDVRTTDVILQFIAKLPHIRHLLATDVIAAYEGDPAAKSPGEAVYCYPSIKALTNFRIAHELFILGVPIIPRIITEIAHSATGIDIHPGATIGERFFIDHGTGVVIGETSIIGNNVRLYQGVTLGAKSFPKDEHGNPIKGIPRHPIVEDDVIIYSGATILGRVTIGKGAVIGGNVWITQDVAPKSTVLLGSKQR